MITQAMIDEHKAKVHRMSLLIRPTFKDSSLRDSTYEESSDITYTENEFKASEQKRKDPEQEFFKMTLVVYKLNYPTSANLPNTEPAFMFKACKKTELPFFKWPDWIKEQMERL